MAPAMHDGSVRPDQIQSPAAAEPVLFNARGIRITRNEFSVDGRSVPIREIAMVRFEKRRRRICWACIVCAIGLSLAGGAAGNLRLAGCILLALCAPVVLSKLPSRYETTAILRDGSRITVTSRDRKYLKRVFATLDDSTAALG